MDELEIIAALRALAQPTRLRIMRLLVKSPGGMVAGDIANALSVRQNTLSSHIAVLERSGMIYGHKQGRNIAYAADANRPRRLAILILTGLGGIAEGRAAKLVPE